MSQKLAYHENLRRWRRGALYEIQRRYRSRPEIKNKYRELRRQLLSDPEVRARYNAVRREWRKNPENREKSNEANREWRKKKKREQPPKPTKTEAKRTKALELYASGMDRESIAKAMGVSTRTIYRYVAASPE